MIPVNLPLLYRRFAEAREARELLKPFAATPEEQFVADRDAVDAAKYRLMVGIEACAQVCSHLLSRLSGTAPESIASCFQVLAHQGVITQDLAVRLTRMARFCNLLVHRYHDVDNRLLHQILREGPEDWEEYISQVETYLKRASGDATTSASA